MTTWATNKFMVFIIAKYKVSKCTKGQDEVIVKPWGDRFLRDTQIYADKH